MSDRNLIWEWTKILAGWALVIGWAWMAFSHPGNKYVYSQQELIDLGDEQRQLRNQADQATDPGFHFKNRSQ